MESLKVGGQTMKANYRWLDCLHSVAVILILLLLGHRFPCEKPNHPLAETYLYHQGVGVLVSVAALRIFSVLIPASMWKNFEFSLSQPAHIQAGKFMRVAENASWKREALANISL